MSPKAWLAVAGVLGAIGVTLGAFGAHVLPGWLAGQGLDGVEVTKRMHNWEVGVRYHMYHALALLVAAWAVSRWPGGAAVAAGWLFVAGTVIFSGSLYLLSFTGQRWLGAVTPLGGLAFILGWAALAWAALRGA